MWNNLHEWPVYDAHFTSTLHHSSRSNYQLKLLGKLAHQLMLSNITLESPNHIVTIENVKRNKMWYFLRFSKLMATKFCYSRHEIRMTATNIKIKTSNYPHHVQFSSFNEYNLFLVCEQ